ncbi:COG4315 family predicted lipoprotein [Actinomadura harenae]|uniref:Lipoprotein with Yx(FWY)xxD motif n=1 Tax=Actinomadura harenae TaxID=2483351 RepID=A0A3M2LJB4_9ACTN|nr:hypothetical protein [Actinomadura harenae]RMI36095.1 hypothetical protein EBO15_39580 [Actinomadura harenae]
MSRTSLCRTGRSSAPVSRPWRSRVALTALPVAALAAAATGCGSSSTSSKSSSSPSESSPPAATTTSAPATTSPPATTSAPGSSAAGGTVATATAAGLGQILVDGHGRTLYLFEKDQGTKSSCTGPCAGVWPPAVSTGKPHAGSGAKSSMIGTTTRNGGVKQTTYGGHPLYYYTPDAGQKGSTKGEGLNQFGGGWYVVSPSGKKVEESSSSGGGGGGY